MTFASFIGLQEPIFRGDVGARAHVREYDLGIAMREKKRRERVRRSQKRRLRTYQLHVDALPIDIFSHHHIYVEC